jgi:hypothetical protein
MSSETAQPNDPVANGHDHKHDHDHGHGHRSGPLGRLAAVFHVGGHSHGDDGLIADPAFTASQEGIRIVWIALGLLADHADPGGHLPAQRQRSPAGRYGA